MRCLRGRLRPARTPIPAALLCTHRCISDGNDVLCQRKCAEYSPTVLPSALVRAEQSGRYRPAVEDNTGTGTTHRLFSPTTWRVSRVVHSRPACPQCTLNCGRGRTKRARLGGMRSHPQINVAGYVRQARRRTRMSQRELAAACAVSASTVSRVEAGRTVLSLTTFSRLLRAAGLRLVVVDEHKRRVPPLKEPPETRDLAGRRFPAHLDLILDPEQGEWWGDHFGLVRPPETFRRDPATRYAHRLVFHRCRGVLVHGETTDWRQRVIEDRRCYQHILQHRQSRFAPNTIPYRRSARARLRPAASVPTHVRDHDH